MLDIAVPHAKNVYEGNPTVHKLLSFTEVTTLVPGMV